MADDGKHVAIVCGTCGSDEVSRDAWADWDVSKQKWVLGAVFDYGHCHKCECESRLIEVELAPAS
jgi:hypothetical protein